MATEGWCCFPAWRCFIRGRGRARLVNPHEGGRTVCLRFFGLLVGAEGYFVVGVEGCNPLFGEVGGHAALVHGIVECCGLDLVDGPFDVVCQYGGTYGGACCFCRSLLMLMASVNLRWVW